MIERAVVATSGPVGAPALRLGHAERGFVYEVGRRYVRDTDAADDVAQEAMLTAFRYRDAFRGDAHPHTWLYRIATTTAYDYLRRRRRKATRDAAAAHLPIADGAHPGADEALIAHERAVELARGLAALDSKYAEILRLRMADLGDREIAARLGLTVGTVKIRAHRARDMLRAALAAREAA